MGTKAKEKQSWVDSFLASIESVCNKLPQPAILFFYLFLIVAVLGAIVTVAGISLVNPATGEVVVSQNFFTKDGILWLLNNLVKNFTGFAPLGLVITMTLGIGLCEEAGLITSLLKSALSNVPPVLIPYIVGFVGTCGNIASDTSTIIIPPAAAMLYLSAGRHPIVGLICGYAASNAGFGANIMIAGTDSLLQGITNTAIAGFIPDSTFTVDVTCNWFFLIASTFLCAIVIGFTCTKIVEPRFSEYKGSTATADEELTPEKHRGLRFAGIATLIYVAVILVGFFSGLLSGENGEFIGSPLLSGLIPVVFGLFCIAGISYGFGAGVFQNSTDVSKAMTKTMASMGSYVSFCFFAGQFQAIFNWTRLGTLFAIAGADGLEAMGLVGIPLFVLFILLIAIVNVFMSSGSSKWAIFAPIFVPMFMLMGYHPGFTQLLYRVGDSPTNALTPMSPYIWMVVSTAQRQYDKDVNIGTIVANMLPIVVILQIIWIIFTVLWFIAGLPIGPGVGSLLPAGIL